ncbi:Uncharacterised protein [Sphingobacterium multivorum]|uniref:Uncharacterized protein n=1 Tax=Sphingobacterium multivorum TaxID=28454 RepID=A0A2X2J1Z0_SPHMU|nr:Uncharacterised protein [Sphingobacterium multivorum]
MVLFYVYILIAYIQCIVVFILIKSIGGVLANKDD